MAIHKFILKTGFFIFIFLTLSIFISCNEVGQLLQQLNVKEPNARIKKVKITNLSLKKADLLFDIAVENPNNLGIHLSGMEYDLLLNGVSFLKGNKQSDLEIKANRIANIDIPISLSYKEVRDVVKSFANLDTIPYRLDLKIGVNLPVLGTIQVPVSKSGSFPNFKMPEISLDGIQLDKIKFSGADLNFKINIKNPNTFGFITNNLNYNLDVNGKNWIKGLLDSPIQIKKRSQQTINVPVSLDFFEMGSAVYQLLTGDSKLNYHLTGKADLNSELEFLKTFTFPFDKSGKIDLTK